MPRHDDSPLSFKPDCSFTVSLSLCCSTVLGVRPQGLELWRPLTSLIYLGPLSMSWLTNVYFLTQHGTRLELVSGTAEQVIFLLLVVREMGDGR